MRDIAGARALPVAMSVRPLSLGLLTSLFLALAACSSASPSGTSTTSDDGGAPESGAISDASDADAAKSPEGTCAALIACMADIAPEAVGGLVSLYGKASNCWKGTAAEAEACGKACAKTLSERPECNASASDAHLLALCSSDEGIRLPFDAEIHFSPRTGGKLSLRPLPRGARYEPSRATEVWPTITLTGGSDGARGATSEPFATTAIAGDGRSVRVERIVVEDFRASGASFCSSISLTTAAPVSATFESGCVYLAVPEGAEIPRLDDFQIRECRVGPNGG